MVQKDISTPMFIVMLLAIAKTWTPPKCPSTEGWIRRCIYYTYNRILLSYKRNKVMPFAAI